MISGVFPNHFKIVFWKEIEHDLIKSLSKRVDKDFESF